MSSVQSLTNFASGLQQAKINDQINTSIAKTALDQAKFQGQAVLELLEAASSIPSIDPNVGKNIDVVA